MNNTTSESDADASSFDEQYTHYYPAAFEGVITAGDKSLCGVTAQATIDARLHKRNLPRCPLCADRLNNL